MHSGVLAEDKESVEELNDFLNPRFSFGQLGCALHQTVGI